jgi:hypothetical protein
VRANSGHTGARAFDAAISQILHNWVSHALIQVCDAIAVRVVQCFCWRQRRKFLTVQSNGSAQLCCLPPQQGVTRSRGNSGNSGNSIDWIDEGYASCLADLMCSARMHAAMSSQMRAAAAQTLTGNKRASSPPPTDHLLALPSQIIPIGKQDVQYPRIHGPRVDAGQLPKLLQKCFANTTAKDAILHPCHPHALTQFRITGAFECTCDLCGRPCRHDEKPDATVLRSIDLTHADDKDTIFQKVWLCTTTPCGMSARAQRVTFSMCARCMW